MEALNNYNFKGYNFTLWFFRILVLMLVVIIAMVFILKINETVSISSGEIVSANPQADYKAPIDAQVLKVYVKEGMAVKAGDTLLVLQNPDYVEQLARTKAEIAFLQNKIQSFATLENSVQKKKAAIEQTSAIAAQKYQLDINRLITDMKQMDEQYTYQTERLSSANEKYMGDSILYKKEMLSKYEFNNTKDANLALKENLSAMQSQRNKQLSEKNLAYNNFTREQNSLLLNKVQLEENMQALRQAKSDFENQLIQAREALKKIETSLNKLNVVAVNSGIVNFLFNTRQASNLINKGDLLVTIAPKSIAYYARVIIPEKDMPYVRSGLMARLKVNAYQRFQQGMIQGKLSYVAERKEGDNFFALVELPQSDQYKLKSGYTVNGEIVIERMPLYKYFIKKLFKRFDQA